MDFKGYIAMPCTKSMFQYLLFTNETEGKTYNISSQYLAARTTEVKRIGRQLKGKICTPPCFYLKLINVCNLTINLSKNMNASRQTSLHSCMLSIIYVSSSLMLCSLGALAIVNNFLCCCTIVLSLNGFIN